ncbi:putative leucine-rich repeat receptor-like protein kinase [Forsythia ovata]|uniref:Leucine-rich repeat receptor-like protein kinase n=1 Tax=Forsythia ovata TaxID=205694 RepID=A0ABD1X9N9_9LAMI
MKVSQASDVYSFGVVLLELLCGKPSMYTGKYGKVSKLVNWVASTLRSEWTLEVIDAELWRYPDMQWAMVKLLQIALICVESVPEHRLKMPEVVKMLEDISGTYTEADRPLEQS